MRTLLTKFSITLLYICGVISLLRTCEHKPVTSDSSTVTSPKILNCKHMTPYFGHQIEKWHNQEQTHARQPISHGQYDFTNRIRLFIEWSKGYDHLKLIWNIFRIYTIIYNKYSLGHKLIIVRFIRFITLHELWRPNWSSDQKITLCDMTHTIVNKYLIYRNK